MENHCLECNVAIDNNVISYSTSKFDIPLCIKHQKWITEISSKTTQETLNLYISLKARGLPAQLEKFDGYKTIDIAIPHAKVNIEIDGAQHNFNPNQALTDLKRTYYSFLKGYITLRIPNALIKWNIEETADYITEILKINRRKVHHY